MLSEHVPVGLCRDLPALPVKARWRANSDHVWTIAYTLTRHWSDTDRTTVMVVMDEIPRRECASSLLLQHSLPYAEGERPEILAEGETHEGAALSVDGRAVPALAARRQGVALLCAHWKGKTIACAYPAESAAPGVWVSWMPTEYFTVPDDPTGA